MLTEPISASKFTLDLSGVAGFFGGDAAVHAMVTVHIYQGRKWLGWYNTPGSYEVARSYGQLGRSRFFDGVYSGVNVDPAIFFERGGKDGPAYRGVHSGTVMAKTGQIAHLLLKHCKGLDDPIRIQGRRTPNIPVTIVTLSDDIPPSESPRITHPHASIFAAIPILSTLGTAVVCAVYRDWFCFSMILLGCVSGGLSCLVLGSGSLKFSYPPAGKGSPRGDGILESVSDMVVLLGTENAVNGVTKGEFSLNFSSEQQYNNVGYCSLLLTAQFVAQLLLVPQGQLFGQIMFLASLCVSWGYNIYLCSIDLELAQADIVMQEILRLDRSATQKFLLPTRTVTVVFVLLALTVRSGHQAQVGTVKDFLNKLLPNDTPVWKVWKAYVIPSIAMAVADPQGWAVFPPMDAESNIDWQTVRDSLHATDPSSAQVLDELLKTPPHERKLLEDLFKDARTGCDAYRKHLCKRLVIYYTL